MQRWGRRFIQAASFDHPLRGDDLSFLLEGLERNFPHLKRIQDLEAYTTYKQIMKNGGGSQKLTLLLSIIFLSYASPTTVSLGQPSDSVYFFSYTHTPVSENFPKLCEKKGITCSQMKNNLRDLWLKSRAYTEGSNNRNTLSVRTAFQPQIA